MREASTPSTRSRISLYTVAILALGDGFTFLAFLLISFFVPGLWTDLVMTAFVAFMGVSFFGMRFLLDLWTVQLPEREAVARVEAERDRVREERFQAEMRRYREQREARLAALVTTNATADTTSAPVRDATTEPGNETEPAMPNTVANTTTQQPPPPVSLPLPVTAPRPPTDTGATPVFMPSDQEGLESTEPPTTAAPNQTSLLPTVAPTANSGPERLNTGSFGALYTRFYMLLIGSLFISLNATAWPASARRFYFTFVAFCYLSFWVPQINRNVKRNCRKALKWEFVLGHSILRLSPFGYFYVYSGNVLFAEVEYKGFAVLVIWVWLQILMLVSQEIVGPRWFVRTTWTTWAPPAYDYHPVLRNDEEGATMPIVFSQATAVDSTPTSPTDARRKSSVELKRRDSVSSASAKERQQKGRRIFDCAICMQDLEVPVVESGAANDNSVTGPAGLLARRSYMVTPCRHIFHSSCLEGWMKFRLQCPICREGLPPL